MRFLIAFIALTVWCGALTFLAKSGIEISDNTKVLSMAVIIAGALAGGDE